MDYFIGRAPGIHSILLWAGSRNRQGGAPPTTRGDVDAQRTVNGVHPSVLDGHLWAFLSLNLTWRGKPVFTDVLSMHGLEIWTRLIGELLILIDLRQVDSQAAAYSPSRAASLPRVRPPVGDWQATLRTYHGVSGRIGGSQGTDVLLKLLCESQHTLSS